MNKYKYKTLVDHGLDRLPFLEDMIKKYKILYEREKAPEVKDVYLSKIAIFERKIRDANFAIKYSIF